MARQLTDETIAALQGALEPGEELKGTIAATWQKTFSGGSYAIGVTDRRIVLQQLDNRAKPKGKIQSLIPEAVSSAEITGAGNDWVTAPSIILDAAAITLKLRTTEGDKMKLMMMRGEGMLQGLSGGEDQGQGVVALAEWVATNFPPR